MSDVSSQPVDKNQKYDRQLRLWGDHGQTSLESSHVCLINASAVGTEILKSLVLPGLGQFTIVDDQTVSGEDAGINFFLQQDDIGEPRAAVAMKCLLEMNEDVKGHSVVSNVLSLLAEMEDFFKRFSCVIATELPESVLAQLSDACSNDIPLLIAQCCGAAAYVRLQVVEHCVVEAHPDNALPDLRLDRPFPALTEFLETQNLSTMDNKEHAHAPYVILFHKYLEEWSAKHGTPMPQNYKERKEFKEMLRAGIRVGSDGVPFMEENFDEALEKANACLCTTRVPAEVQAILRDPCVEMLTESSSNFWVLVKALERFVTEKGCLPLRGTLPDMTADTDRYIAIQSIYRQKAVEDGLCVYKTVEEICKEIGKDPKSISEEETLLFCKNAAFLRVVRCRPFADEVRKPESCRDEINSALDRDDEHMAMYVVFRAALRFHEKHGHLPGEMEGDLELFKDIVACMISDWNLSALLPEKTIGDFVSYGGSQLPFVSGFVGAIVSQEVIKLLTTQFVPFNNTLIYANNGIVTFQL